MQLVALIDEGKAIKKGSNHAITGKLSERRVQHVLTFAAIVIGAACLPADAATVGHWRFEDSPGFTHDSAGTAHLINSGATQYTLPGSGDGLGIHPVEIPRARGSVHLR